MRRMQSVIMPLIIANIIVFIMQVVLGDMFTYLFMLVPNLVIRMPWQVFTSMFLHGGFDHIFFNMYGLLIFGPLLEQRIGPKRFLLLYLCSGVAASIGHIIFSNLIYGDAAPALGASGAIMGMIGALIVLMPDLRLLFMFIIPMPLWVAGIFWAAIDTFGIFFPSGVGNIAHLVGMAVGLLYGLYLKKQKKRFYRRFGNTIHLTSDDVEEYLSSGRI